MFPKKSYVHLLVIYYVFLSHLYMCHTLLLECSEFLVWQLLKTQDSPATPLGHVKLKRPLKTP